MMKRIMAIICAVILIGTVFSACNLFQKPNHEPTQSTPSAVVTEASATQAVEETEASQATAVPATQAPADGGTLSDYVRTAKEAQVSDSKTLRLPEILLDSADADAANSEIMTRFGEYVDDPEANNYVISLDYEAYLNGEILSVMVSGSFDGGNSYGQCYSFDVTTGVKLSNAALCTMSGHDYDTAKTALKTNLTTYYDEKYSGMPGNDEMRDQTLDDANITAAIMYLDGSGKLMAMTDIYAAVGGGHWVTSISAE